MKAQLIGGEKVKQEIKFPVLAMWTKKGDTGLVVMFFNNTDGIVLKEGKLRTNLIGMIRRNTEWANITEWEILPPDAQIVLQND